MVYIKIRDVEIWPDVLDTSQTNGCEITVVNTSLNAGTTREGKDQQRQSEFLQPTHLFFCLNSFHVLSLLFLFISANSSGVNKIRG
jgi:hypothetical protein